MVMIRQNRLIISLFILLICVNIIETLNMWTSFDGKTETEANVKKPRCVSPCKIFHSWCKNDGKCRERGRDCTWYCECPENCEGFFCEKIVTEDKGAVKAELTLVVEETKSKPVSGFDQSKLSEALASIYTKKRKESEEKSAGGKVKIIDGPETISRIGKTIDVKENVTSNVTIICPPDSVLGTTLLPNITAAMNTPTLAPNTDTTSTESPIVTATTTTFTGTDETTSMYRDLPVTIGSIANAITSKSTLQPLIQTINQTDISVIREQTHSADVFTTTPKGEKANAKNLPGHVNESGIKPQKERSNDSDIKPISLEIQVNGSKIETIKETTSSATPPLATTSIKGTTISTDTSGGDFSSSTPSSNLEGSKDTNTTQTKFHAIETDSPTIEPNTTTTMRTTTTMSSSTTTLSLITSTNQPMASSVPQKTSTEPHMIDESQNMQKNDTAKAIETIKTIGSKEHAKNEKLIRNTDNIREEPGTTLMNSDIPIVDRSVNLEATLNDYEKHEANKSPTNQVAKTTTEPAVMKITTTGILSTKINMTNSPKDANNTSGKHFTTSAQSTTKSVSNTTTKTETAATTETNTTPDIVPARLSVSRITPAMNGSVIVTTSPASTLFSKLTTTSTLLPTTEEAKSPSNLSISVSPTSPIHDEKANTSSSKITIKVKEAIKQPVITKTKGLENDGDSTLGKPHSTIVPITTIPSTTQTAVDNVAQIETVISEITSTPIAVSADKLMKNDVPENKDNGLEKENETKLRTTRALRSSTTMLPSDETIPSAKTDRQLKTDGSHNISVAMTTTKNTVEITPEQRTTTTQPTVETTRSLFKSEPLSPTVAEGNVIEKVANSLASHLKQQEIIKRLGPFISHAIEPDISSNKLSDKISRLSDIELDALKSGIHDIVKEGNNVYDLFPPTNELQSGGMVNKLYDAPLLKTTERPL